MSVASVLLDTMGVRFTHTAHISWPHKPKCIHKIIAYYEKSLELQDHLIKKFNYSRAESILVFSELMMNGDKYSRCKTFVP